MITFPELYIVPYVYIQIVQLKTERREMSKKVFNLDIQ
jgi:hypothetical protein